MIPWVAAGQAPHAQQQAAPRPVRRYSLLRIARAARCETTIISKQWAQQKLVKAYEPDQYRAHFLLMLRKSFSRLARISALVLVVMPRRAMTTTSVPERSCWIIRKVSRAARLIRLRRTAVPAVLTEMASPSRGTPSPLLRPNTENRASPTRTPPSNTCLNSAGRRSRALPVSPQRRSASRRAVTDRVAPGPCAAGD